VNRETKHFFLNLPLYILNKVYDQKVHCIQIGANDGQIADPLYPFLSQNKWSGVLIEPNPLYFKRVQALHADRHDIITLNVGASDSDGEMTLHYLAEEHEALYRENARGCASFDRERMVEALLKERPEAEDHVAEVTVALRPLKDILAEQKITRTDALVIDTEGHELSVLAGADLASLRPKVAIVENNTRENKRQIVKVFKDLGYNCFSHMSELVAFSPEMPELSTTDVFEAAKISRK
jgi:FkbM family methyltransferase